MTGSADPGGCGGILFDRATAGPAPRWRTIPELAADAAARFGQREFLRFGETSLSFGEVHERSSRLGRVLAGHGVRPGDRVAIMMDNVADWPVSWLAILAVGAVAVPVNVRYQQADLAFVLADSGAALVLTGEAQAGLVRSVAAASGRPVEVRTMAELAGELAAAAEVLPGFTVPGVTVPGNAVPGNAVPGNAVPGEAAAVARQPADIANFQYTSGTTGFPKACMLSHRYWLTTGWLTAIEAELRAGDVMLMAQAFSYMDPQWACVMCLMGGRPLVVLPRFSASGFWASAREHGATLTYLLGAMPTLLFRQPRGVGDTRHRMRLVLCSGIVPGLHRALEERWGVPWRELYGSTESGLDLAVPPGAAETVGTGAVGRPPPGKEVRIADEAGRTLPDGETGQILIRGEPMMHGYWNHQDATERAFRGGWYHSGDLGYRDTGGWIHHAGRLKDIIRRGGENISAAEVENVLALHPAVAAAALAGIPDEVFGELPKAFVLLRPGYQAGTATALSLAGHLRGQLAGFKVPAYLEFVDSFELTPSARIRKRTLLPSGRDQRAGAFDLTAGCWTASDTGAVSGAGAGPGLARGPGQARGPGRAAGARKER